MLNYSLYHIKIKIKNQINKTKISLNAENNIHHTKPNKGEDAIVVNF